MAVQSNCKSVINNDQKFVQCDFKLTLHIFATMFTNVFFNTLVCFRLLEAVPLNRLSGLINHCIAGINTNWNIFSQRFIMKSHGKLNFSQ